MTRILCDGKTCRYNDDGVCQRDIIHLEGDWAVWHSCKDALTTDEYQKKYMEEHPIELTR